AWSISSVVHSTLMIALWLEFAPTWLLLLGRKMGEALLTSTASVYSSIGRAREAMDVKVSIERADSPEVLNLIEEHRRKMRALYSDGAVHSFDPREAAAPPGVFVVARVH